MLQLLIKLPAELFLLQFGTVGVKSVSSVRKKAQDTEREREKREREREERERERERERVSE